MYHLVCNRLCHPKIHNITRIIPNLHMGRIGFRKVDSLPEGSQNREIVRFRISSFNDTALY